ncbi:NAD-dependent epimerase/dehydratase family protein [candidate division WOR-3 bacterium]|nr:NAD-dependent epimerase/dehydratase family protein [candidate division WOR-3 bacterium]
MPKMSDRKSIRKYILVTGGDGFIGTNLINELMKDKNNLVINFTEDICEGIKIDCQVDLIYHMAANTDTTFSDDVEMYRNNLIGFLKVLDFAIKHNCRLIYASSGAIYGNVGEPLNVYGHSKLLCDKIAERFINRIPLVGLRFFNVYGPYEQKKERMASMITQWREQIAKGKKPGIFIGEFKRDFVYVKDIIRALLQAQNLKSGFYDVGTGKAIDFRDVLDIVIEVLGVKVEPKKIPNPYLGKYQTFTKADISWGFKPKYPIRKGIKDYFKN